MQNIGRAAQRVFKEHGVVGSALLFLKLPLSPLLRSDFGTRLSRAYYGWTFDRRFGVDTAGFISEPIPSVAGCVASWGRPYDGSNPTHFARIIRSLNLRYEEFSFVDFGSGKGRVLMLASAFPFRSVTGVEWSGELHEVAKRNLGVYGGPRACETVKSFCMDAGEFPIPDGKLVLYFFNPFKDAIMARVLENIRTSFEARPRDIAVVYVNPKSREMFDGAGFLERTADRGWFVVYRTTPRERLPRVGSTVLSWPAA